MPFRPGGRHGENGGYLYALSKCDYIVGTYSTYFIWAAFLGNKRKYETFDPKKPILLNDFKSFNEPEPMLIW